jgi:hypothetical protein
MMKLQKQFLHGVSEGTRGTYDSAWKSWADFVFMFGGHIRLWNPEEVQLMLYVNHRAAYLKVKTVAGYLYGIRRLHVERGLRDPLKGKVALVTLLRDLKKRYAVPSRPKFSLTTEVLLKLVSSFERHTHDGRMLWAAKLVGVFGLLRGGEFMVSNGRQPRLLLEHIRWLSTHHFTLRLVWSKMDISRIGYLVHFFANGSVVCPVAAMKDYLSRCPIVWKHAGQSALFRWKDGSPLDKKRDRVVMGDMLAAAGYSMANYGAVSCRRGGALSLSQAGQANHVIQIMGRWKSESFLRYIDTSQVDMASAARAMVPK